MQETPDVLIFLGRFHPLVVHLPIGFVCLALLAELFFRKSNQQFQPLIRFMWLLAALSSTLSVVLGYFLSLQGGYDDSTLSWHKWSGIFLALVIHCIYFWKKNTKNKIVVKYAMKISFGLCVLLLIITGHFGGSLTHGDDYLTEHTPETFAELFGASSENAETAKKISSLDSADIFADAIVPILKSKCVSCHNPKKKKGGLILDSIGNILKGGEDGPGVVPGDLGKSGIYSRVTLPEDDKKFMPANGKKPLTSQQIAIIKWWIEKQAPTTGIISAMKPDSVMNKTFIAYFGIDENSGQIDLAPPTANPTIIAELKNQGFAISTLSETSNLLQANLSEVAINKIKIEKLSELKNQLVWLRISNAGKLEDEMKTIGKLINLRKLSLMNSEIPEQAIDELLSLTNLEYLNLYGTKLQISSVEKILKLAKLKQLIVGKTNLDPTSLDSLAAKYPGVKIIYKEPENATPTVDSIPSIKK